MVYPVVSPTGYVYKPDEIPFAHTYDTTQKLTELIVDIYIICERYGLLGENSVYAKLHRALMRGITSDFMGAVENDVRRDQYRTAGFMSSKPDSFTRRKVALADLLDRFKAAGAVTSEAYVDLMMLINKADFPQPDDEVSSEKNRENSYSHLEQ